MQQQADVAVRPPADTAALKRWSLILGAGFFAVTLSQPALLDLPIRALLKDELGMTPSEMAAFTAVGGILWYFKPVAGLLSDAVPLFGTRRKHYLIFGSLFAGAFWVLMGLAPRTYGALLASLIAMNAAMVLVSSVLGGLLVETEQELNAGGRLVSVRFFVESACIVLAGPLAGLLAGLPFLTAAIVGGLVAISAVPFLWLMMQEPRAEVQAGSVVSEAYEQLALLVRSRAIWIMAAFLVIVCFPQGYSTALYYHQTNALQLSVGSIGWLKAAGGLGSVGAAIVYGMVGPRFTLRVLLSLALVAEVIGVGAYIFYTGFTAAFVIEFASGFLLSLTGLALIEASVWATPKLVAAMGFAVLMSAFNAGIAIGDIAAALMVERWAMSFYSVMQVFTAVAGLIAVAFFLLPRGIFRRGDEG